MNHMSKTRAAPPTALVILALLSAVGCEDEERYDAALPDAGTPSDAGPSDAGFDAGPEQFGLEFDPSNVGNRAHLQEYGPDVTCGHITFNTDDGTASCGEFRFEVISQPGVPGPAGTLGVFYGGGFEVNTIAIEGSRPAVIVASGPIVLNGNVDARNGLELRSSRVNIRGLGEGGGGAPTSAGSTDPGAGGGGFCSAGGSGSSAPSGGGAALGGAPGRTYGDVTLQPLRFGSTGGQSQRAGLAGQAGGALQLVSGVEIRLGRTARIWLGHWDSTRFAGGSSGGALLLEAPVVRIDGAISNGGSDAEVGGAGSNDGLAGVSGTPGANEGGGGGSGYIRINTSSRMADIALDAALQPPEASPCLTLGFLSPRTEPTPVPTCDALSTTPDECELCLGENCCDQLIGCREEALCELCLDTAPSERGPGCTGDTSFQALRACAASVCPSVCSAF